MNANDAKMMTEKAIADDYKNFPKYFKKSLDIVEIKIKEACLKGYNTATVDRHDVVRHVKLTATRQEVILKLIHHFQSLGFRAVTEEYARCIWLYW